MMAAEGRGWSALGPYRIGNLRIRAGRSGHDGYEGIAGRSTFPAHDLGRPTAWRRLRIPPPLPPPAVPPSVTTCPTGGEHQGVGIAGAAGEVTAQLVSDRPG